MIHGGTIGFRTSMLRPAVHTHGTPIFGPVLRLHAHADGTTHRTMRPVQSHTVRGRAKHALKTGTAHGRADSPGHTANGHTAQRFQTVHDRLAADHSEQALTTERVANLPYVDAHVFDAPQVDDGQDGGRDRQHHDRAGRVAVIVQQSQRAHARDDERAAGGGDQSEHGAGRRHANGMFGRVDDRPLALVGAERVEQQAEPQAAGRDQAGDGQREHFDQAEADAPNEQVDDGGDGEDDASAHVRHGNLTLLLMQSLHTRIISL